MLECVYEWVEYLDDVGDGLVVFEVFLDVTRPRRLKLTIQTTTLKPNTNAPLLWLFFRLVLVSWVGFETSLLLWKYSIGLLSSVWASFWRSSGSSGSVMSSA